MKESCKSLGSGSSSSEMAAVFSSSSKVLGSGHRYPSSAHSACCLVTAGPASTDSELVTPVETLGLPH